MELREQGAYNLRSPVGRFKKVLNLPLEGRKPLQLGSFKFDDIRIFTNFVGSLLNSLDEFLCACTTC
jgi:hypothetical protein